LQIRERLRGPDDPTVASALANLGSVYVSSAQYDKAVETLTRALSIQEKRLAPNHAALATPSFNLAAVYFSRGDFDAAEKLFQRALSIDQQNLAPGHPLLATRLMGLAEVLRLKGEYERADPLYEQAFTIREHALGPTHPQVADALIGRSLLRWATSNFSDAVTLLARGAALREQTLALVLTAGSEEAKRLYLRTLDDETDIAVSLHLGSAPQSTTAAVVAFGNVLERKGRSLDAMTDHLATLRRRLDDSDRELLNQLSRAQGQLAALLLRGVSTDDQKNTAAALRAEIQRLEESASSRSSELRASFTHATLAEIREAVPDDTVLIEYVSYRPFFVRNKRAEAFGARRYAAYVLRGDGITKSVDLGDAAAIEQNVQRLRAALATPDNGDARQLARALYKQIVEPMETPLQDANRVVVSPDGALNLIPFGALVTPRNRFLVETHTISYVTSGRDLPGLLDNRRKQRVASAPAVFADPLFDGLRVTTGPRAETRGIDAGVLSKALQFDSLPGTADEAKALAKVLPDARIFMGADATEARLKSLRGPAILHIATHGFFLPGAARTAPPSSLPASVVNAPSTGGTIGDREEALVLSGVALAGANQRSSGDGEDGILTALETAGLDLWGTRLVVLSACETGIGDVKHGDGVYGLRRALVLAGSESQVMSLWQVSDEATRHLMVDYYRRLRRGEGRADALRQVQLAMLKGRQNLRHPFYWASFILSGDWRPAFE
jgi:CHAT domain-containing protein